MAIFHREDGLAPNLFRQIRDAFEGRRRTPLLLFVLPLVPSALLLAYIAVQPHVPVEQFFRDVHLATKSATPGQWPPLLGFASNVGILLWCGSAATAFFAALVLIERRAASEPAWFLLAIAFYSGLLCVDDLFMLHEQVYPIVLGLREKAMFALYAALLAATLIRFRHLVIELGPALLVLALACFALSIVGDAAPLERDLRRWAEDGPKLVGIALWATWTIRIAWLLCTER